MSAVAGKDGGSQISGIHRLPPEVLTQVFWYLVHQICSTEWMRITHLCRYWRITALGSGALWFDISEATPSVEVWLARSKNHPLTIHLRRDDDKSLPLLQSILQELHRIQELRLTLSYSLWMDLLPDLQHPAPILESFSCVAWGESLSEYEPFTLPANTFAGVAPRLRSASMAGFDFELPIIPSTFHGLTSLKIGDPSLLFSPEEALEVLRPLPNLESLTFTFEWDWYEGDEDEDPTHIPEPLSIVNLPRLSQFTFTASLQGQMYLLRRLTFPVTTALVLETVASDDDLENFSGSLCNLIRASDHARGDSIIPVHRMELSIGNEPTDMDVKIHRKIGTQNVLLDLTFMHDYPEGDYYFPSIPQFFGCVPFSRKYSILHTDFPISSRSWSKAPEYLSNLTHLALFGPAAENFLDCLNEHYDVPSPPSDHGSDEDWGDDVDSEESDEENSDEEEEEEEEGEDDERQENHQDREIDVSEDEDEGEDDADADSSDSDQSNRDLEILPPHLISIEIDGPDPSEHSIGGLIETMKEFNRRKKTRFLALKLRLWAPGRYNPKLVQPLEKLVWRCDATFTC